MDTGRGDSGEHTGPAPRDTFLSAGKLLHGEAPGRLGKPACDFLGRTAALPALPTLSQGSTPPGQTGHW